MHLATIEPLRLWCVQKTNAPWSFYILGAGETPAPQPEATTASIVVQASSLQSVRLKRSAPYVRLTHTTRATAVLTGFLSMTI